ncbi:serine-rich adhesin for platelets-like isoform X2 [Argopecten irradians]|uniref:serine-rich adhesin for platelets-like isoform X2 n=1 Tax=Argopecten irradians TaxID=31199 RepID=UPI00370FA80F
MFHLEYPQFRGFYSWDELGCLARALGFPIDLFKDNLADEIEQEEHGLSIKEVYKMLDNRLLERAVHRTQNLHTAEWNMNAIRKSVSLLDHRAITFEGLYNTRVAYQAYEGFDMMGLHIEKQTLLNTLKMCGRSIAPMKLLNRVKHMTHQLEEKGRIQLYEFLDLVMWCCNYENFSPEDIAFPPGKDRDLFKLVDFEKLLSHHDERLAEKLNNEYLLEEWDFGKEHLGSSHMFKDPPVRCAEDRINMTRRQKRLYRHLKSEVNKSQRGVYRAKAGYIRERPLTAPDLSMYQPKDGSPHPVNFSAQTAYQMIQDKVKSARPGDSAMTDTSDRPLYVEAEPVERPCGITSDDLQDAQKKFEVLQFDMETIDGRFQIMKDDTMDVYYPGHKQRYEEEVSVSMQRPKSEIPKCSKKELQIKKERPKSESHLLNLRQKEHTTTKPAHSDPSIGHTKLSAARFRVWHDPKPKVSHHSKSSLSFKGSLEKHSSKTTSEIKVKGQFTYEPKDEADDEITISPSSSHVKVSDSNDAGEIKEEVTDVDKDLSRVESCKTDLSPAGSCRTMDTGYSSFDDRSSTSSTKEFTISKSKSEKGQNSRSGFKANFGKSSPSHSHSATSSRKSTPKNDSQITKVAVEIVPHMDHSKPRPVSVGGMGTISLLENISEARYWEDVYNGEDESSTEDSDATPSTVDSGIGRPKSEVTPRSIDSGIRRRQRDELQSSLSLLKQRLSEQPLPAQSKTKQTKKKSNMQPKVNDQDCEMLEKELRIKKQRRSQQPSSNRMPQNLVQSSSSESALRSSVKSNLVPGNVQYVKPAVKKNVSTDAQTKSMVTQSDHKSSLPSQKLSSFHRPGDKRETIHHSNNTKTFKTSKGDDKMKNELNKNPKVRRLVKRGEGLLSADLMKKLITTLA